MEVKLTIEQAGLRLDQALTAVMDLTRAQIQKFFKQDLVSIDGKDVRSSYRVSGTESVTIKERVKLADPQVDVVPEVLYEDRDFIIINKPSGLTVHSGTHITGYTLVDWLVNYCPAVKKVGDDPWRPGIVHRLDKDASGVMVIAKTQHFFEQLKKQFKFRHVQKEYLVLIYGQMVPSEGEIKFNLARSKNGPQIVATTEGGRESATKYWTERVGPKVSLVRALPSTGRTHQIRVHFYASGHPLLGDKVYFSKKIKSLACSRLMLHASVLSFKDTDGKERRFEAPISPDFAYNLGLYLPEVE